MTAIIGIDLGTTNSAVAYLSGEGPRLIPNALGEVLTPSVIGIDFDGKLLVGRAARELQVLHPDRCAAVFKRHMGSVWSTEIAGRRFTPEELSALVLRSLKEDAEAFFGGRVEDAVVTVPAYFNDHQRKATLNAGRIAELNVGRILNEPTAAALAYGFHESREEKKLLIFDLGGGTFDVSLVELFEGVLEVKASSGESFLGGEDFTRALAARVLEQRKLTFEHTELSHPRLVSRLLQQCEVAKCLLSSQNRASLRIPDHNGDFPPDAAEIPLTREQFEGWTAHVLDRVELPVRRVLGDVGLAPDEVDEVILVGGATRMPAVTESVVRLFGKPAQCRLDPDEVVALGAGVQAGLLARNQAVKDLVITDVAPFTLGVAVCKQIGPDLKEGYFLPVIDRNTTIPVSRVKRVSTVTPNQTQVDIRIFQGECRRVEDNLLLGEFSLGGIPPGPIGQALDIRFSYDLNGVLEVEATIVATGKKAAHVITRHARGLSPEQITQAVKAMALLKRHPRDEEPHRTLLRRAERVFRELSPEGRQQLDGLLDGFEAALELRSADAIASQRTALREFLDRFEESYGRDAWRTNDDPEPS